MAKTILKRIESVINRSPFYNFIRFNPLADLIIETRTGKTKKAIAFYSSFLDARSPNKLIFDIGANKGNKVNAFLKMGFKVVAVEPEKKSLSTLHYRFKHKKVSIVEKGVSDKEGTLTINVAEGRSGLNTLSDKWVGSLGSKETNRWEEEHAFKKSYEVPITTLEKLFLEFGVPYYIKIDVEGYEKNVIKGLERSPSFISFETNLPEFCAETIDCILHLQSLSPGSTYNYSVKDELESNQWLSGEQMIALVEKGEIRYMEIIGRLHA